MELDRLDAEEERGSGLAVRGAAGDDRRDLQLLRRERVFRLLLGRPHRLAGSAQLDAGALRPRLCPEPLERLERGPQPLARRRSLLRAP